MRNEIIWVLLAHGDSSVLSIDESVPELANQYQYQYLKKYSVQYETSTSTAQVLSVPVPVPEQQILTKNTAKIGNFQERKISFLCRKFKFREILQFSSLKLKFEKEISDIFWKTLMAANFFALIFVVFFLFWHWY